MFYHFTSASKLPSVLLLLRQFSP
uniref:Uncharacterized protein n=1 Tax=Rhizophora mucronata TaxID=61149 RepID=A0A2P2QGF2_RHIMU